MTKVRFVTLDFDCVIPEGSMSDEDLTDEMIAVFAKLGVKVDATGSAVTGYGEIE